MKLLDRVDLVGRRLRLSSNTIDAYSSWIRGYLTFCGDRRGRWTHPVDLGTADCEAYLNDLVLRRRLSPSSQNQALNALVFLYHHVLEGAIPQDHLGKFVLLRSRRKKRIPTVLSVAEVALLLRSITLVMNKPAIAVTSPLDRLPSTELRVKDGAGPLDRLPSTELRVQDGAGPLDRLPREVCV